MEFNIGRVAGGRWYQGDATTNEGIKIQVGAALIGDLYLSTTEPNYVWSFNGTDWAKDFFIKGVPGPTGRDGRPGRDGKDGISVNTLRPLFVSRGAVWNETTGFYELNGLTDITEEQMIQIYNQTSATLIGMDWNEKCLHASCRTNFESNSVGRYVGGLNAMAAFAVTNMETILISSMDNSPFSPYRIEHIFRNSIKLRNIIGIMLGGASNNGAFIGCKSLEDITIKSLTRSIYLGDSPLLTRDSILYLINNAENTAPITVALHATALSRLTQADIALASSKNITLAA